MLIVSFKPGHDGAVAVIEDGVVRASLEAEKDSFLRYDNLDAPQLIDSLAYVERIPDVICLSGWYKGGPMSGRQVGGGYLGIDDSLATIAEKKVLGKDVKLFSSTHERSHIYCAVGLSPYADVSDCYCLIWEGEIGRFYKVSKNGAIQPFPTVVNKPGNKYSFLYALADPTVSSHKGYRHEDAGKLMALTSYGEPGTPTPKEQAVIDWILSQSDNIKQNNRKDELKESG